LSSNADISLAAHQEHWEERNSDYRAIRKSLRFSLNPDESASASGEALRDGAELFSAAQGGKWGQIGLLEHDFVWWMGDLNYRIGT